MVLVPTLVIGVLLLALGRQLFWLFVGGAGFLIGLQLAPQLLPNLPQETVLIAALVLGLIGAVLAVLLQRFAVGLAGFVVGGFAAAYIARALGLTGSTPPATPGFPAPTLAGFSQAASGALPVWLVFLAGGILGAILVAALFNLALMILSAIAGSSLIVQSLPMPAGLGLVVFLVLIVLGIALQSRIFGRR